jgi:spermidine/putrescine transport system permease protein
VSRTRRLPPILSAIAVATIVFLYLPLAAVAAMSLNSARFGAAWKGLSLRWYVQLAHNELVVHAAANTLVLAVVSTAISTVLGTLLAIGLERFPWPQWMRRLIDAVVYVPVVTPDIVFAVGMLLAFEAVRQVLGGLRLGMGTMIVAHVTFQISFVALVVGSRLATLGRSVEEAARDLYAGSWHSLRRVTLPLIAPGIVAGAMLAFTLSLDDFVISFFTSGPASVTLPLYIYGSLRRGHNAGRPRPFHNRLPGDRCPRPGAAGPRQEPAGGMTHETHHHRPCLLCPACRLQQVRRRGRLRRNCCFEGDRHGVHVLRVHRSGARRAIREGDAAEDRPGHL